MKYHYIHRFRIKIVTGLFFLSVIGQAVALQQSVAPPQRLGGLAAARAKERTIRAADPTRLSARASRDRLRSAAKMALQKERIVQEERDGLDEKPVTVIQEQRTPDRFTQSEAHMQLDEVKKILMTYPPDEIAPYLFIITDCLVKEAELKNSHYVFYYALDNKWRVSQDLYRQLCAYYGASTSDQDFTSVRFGKLQKISAQEMFVKQLKESRFVDDNANATAGILLSVNMAILGNIGSSGECTWSNFLKKMDNSSVSLEQYREIFDLFGLPYTHIKELMALDKTYLSATEKQDLLQIFVPRDKVDGVAYLAATDEFISKNIKKKSNVEFGVDSAIKSLISVYKQEGEKNSRYKSLIEKVAKGDCSVDAFLKVYRNKPGMITNANKVLARLLLTPDVLLNSNSDFKFYHYVTTDRSTLEKYYKDLNAIVEKIINEKKVNKGQSEGARRIALEKEQRNQRVQAHIETIPLKEVQKQAEVPNAFTQTEAFLMLPELRKKVAKDLKIAPYLSLISEMVVKEALLKDTHYVFYHGTDNVWRLSQDLFTQLYAYFNALKESEVEEFTFLRFKSEAAPTPQQFLAEEMQKGGLINDTGELKFKLLSTNLTPFANVGLLGECTWNYFMEPKSHESPKRIIYEGIMDTFGLTHGYINELMTLTDIYQTPEQTILQIFVPKEKVDSIAYLAWVKGIPAHKEIIEWIKKNLSGKIARETASDTIQELTKTFNQEKEKNPLFRDLLESIQEGDFSIAAFLKIYCNEPWKLININDVSVRLIFSPEILLNPNSGVKFYRYSTARTDQIREYHKRLKFIIDKLIAEKEQKD